MAQLQVTVIEGKNLKQKDTFTSNDSFVEIYLDDKHQKQRSKTKHNSNNPQWNQSFVFNHLTGQDTLHIDIYDEDSVKDDRIGSSIVIDLHQLYEQGDLDKWFNIPSREGAESDGEIHLVLHYEELIV